MYDLSLFDHIKTQGQILKLLNNFTYLWQPIFTDHAILSLSLSKTNILREQIIYQVY